MSASESLMPGPEGKTPRYYDVDRGQKTESYINAISGNPVPAPKGTPYTKVPVEAIPLKDVKPKVPRRDSQIGLTEEELNEFKDSEGWKCLRLLLFVLFWILWILMFLAAILLVFMSPGCAILAKPHWWQSAVSYNVWIPAFQDSDGDGVGDVPGLVSRLENLRKAGVQTVWPSPFLLSDNLGSAVRNYAQMDSRFGVNQAADEMIQKIHDKEMKVVISIPIATTSLEHEWFLASAAASKPENKNYSEFYHWTDNQPDGEFVSQHKGLGYLHEANDSRAAVLNWQNTNVRTHMFEVLSNWIDRGVDGFYLQGIEYLARTRSGSEPDWSAIQDIIRDIRDHVDTYAGESAKLEGEEKKIALFASREDAKEKDKRHLTASGLDSVINYELGKIAKDTDICHKTEGTVAFCVHEILSDVLLFHTQNDGIIPQWEFGNADISRLATRVGSRVHAELISMLQLMLPGANNIYYGEEIGMRDLTNDSKVAPQRGVMQWDDSKMAGFSERENVDIALSPDYKNINWKRQYEEAQSQLKMFSKLAKLRHRDETMINGKTFIGRLVDNGFTITRFLQRDNVTVGNVYVAAVNFADHPVSLPLQDLPNHAKLAKTQIITTTSNVKTWVPRQMVDLSDKSITLQGEEGVVFRYMA